MGDRTALFLTERFQILRAQSLSQPFRPSVRQLSRLFCFLLLAPSEVSRSRSLGMLDRYTSDDVFLIRVEYLVVCVSCRGGLCRAIERSTTIVVD